MLPPGVACARGCRAYLVLPAAAALLSALALVSASPAGAATAASGAGAVDCEHPEECPEAATDEVSLLHVGLTLTRRVERTQPDGNATELDLQRSQPIGLAAAPNVSAAARHWRDRLANATPAFRLEPMPASTEPVQQMRIFDVLAGEAIKKEVEEEVSKWFSKEKGNRYRSWARVHPHTGPHRFFASAELLDWLFLVLALAVFFKIHLAIMNWPSTRRWHGAALFLWIALAAAYNGFVFARFGHERGKDWLTGYMLEFIFSLENVFIYHVVTKSFRMPRSMAQKALVFVVVFQTLFQLLFFMGLATLLKSVRVLPYLVGAWLVYVAYHTLSEDDEEDVNKSRANLQEPFEELPRLARFFQSLLGDRFIPTYEDETVLVVKEGRLRVSLLAPAVLSLLLVDFLMEIDVTLTKIEEIPNHFVAFTSSMAAAFAVPELFFVARDLFAYFRFLKFGISFVLVFFGVQLLCHRWISIPDMVGLLIIIAVMAFCALLSAVIPEPEGLTKKAIFEGGPEKEQDEPVFEG